MKNELKYFHILAAKEIPETEDWVGLEIGMLPVPWKIMAFWLDDLSKEKGLSFFFFKSIPFKDELHRRMLNLDTKSVDKLIHDLQAIK